MTANTDHLVGIPSDAFDGDAFGVMDYALLLP